MRAGQGEQRPILRATKTVRPVLFAARESVPQMLRNPARTGGAREPERDARAGWQGQPLEGKRAGLRHADPRPGRTAPAFHILTFPWPGTIAVLGRKTLRFVPTAAPPPMLLAIAHQGEMAMEKMRHQPAHEHRQTMFLVFAQGRIKWRSRVRDRFEILAPRHRVFAAPPQPVDEACGRRRVLEFLAPGHRIVGRGAHRGLDGGPEFFLLRRQFQTGVEGGDPGVEESGAVGGRENLLFRAGRNVGRDCSARPLKAASATPEPTTAIIVKAAGKPGFIGVLQFSIVARSAKPFRLSHDHVEMHRLGIDKCAAGFK